jgi:centrosomal protein CEP135
LQETLANKEKSIAQMGITVSEYELSVDYLKETSTNQDQEIRSLQCQLDADHKEFDEVGKSGMISFKECKRLKDNLAAMARKNQGILLELEREVKERWSRIHNCITEVS